MTPTVTPVPERVAELEDLVLLPGGHAPGKGEFCFNEALAYIAGEPHSANPKCQSPVLRNLTTRLNDRWDTESRQRLKPYLLRCLGTAGDGKDDARRAIAARWAINTRLPHWLELAGLTDRADELRNLDVGQWDDKLADLLREVRDECWAARTAARGRLKDAVQAELEKRWKTEGKKPAGAVAAAAAAAVADAAAVAVAVAAAAAVADAAAVAVAVAGTERYWKIRDAAYKAIKPKMDERVAELDLPTVDDTLALLERMIDPDAPVQAEAA